MTETQRERMLFRADGHVIPLNRSLRLRPLKSTGRWLAVLPASLVAASLAEVAVRWLVAFTWRSGGLDGFGLLVISPESTALLGIAFIVPYVFVSTGARVAPRHKTWTSWSLGALLVLLGVLLAVYGFRGSAEFNYSGAGWFEFAAAVGLNVAGIATAIRSAESPPSLSSLLNG